MVQAGQRGCYRWMILCVIVGAPLFAQGGGQAVLPKAPTDVKAGSITYEEIPYPYPVSFLPLTLYGQDVRMAYMDIPPAGQPNGRTVLLLHGMNFGGFYFSGPIEALRQEGFRIVVPDQIGFGRSSKPIIPYNFNDMAWNTRKLLQSLGLTRVAVVGHSMGGMLAARFSASYPDMTERAVLYNPIGLTDVRYQAPWPSADDAYRATMAQSQDQLYQGFYATIRRYFPTPGAWKPEYEQYVRILYAPTLSADWPRLAMVRAIYRQITYLDPVVYDWPKIKAKTLVLGGDKDGENFPVLARHAADSIPGAELVLIPNAGHVPHLEMPEIFNRELLKFLKSDPPAQADGPNSKPNPYRTVEAWFHLPAGRTMGSTSAVDVDPQGHIWVVERCGVNTCEGSSLAPVLEFDRSGNLLKSFGAGMFLFPHGIGIDKEGNVWITDGQGKDGKGQQVIKFSPEGKVLMTLGKAGVAGDGPDTFNQPNDVAIAPNGDIFVSDGHSPGTGNSRIVKFTKDGKFIKQWGRHGSGPGEFETPHTLAFDSRGRLFVGDRANNRIQIFDQDGNFIDQWKQFSRPSGIYIDAHDVLYVTDSESTDRPGYGNHPGWKRGIRIGSAKDGTVTAFIPDPSAGTGATSAAEGVAADAQGVVYGAEVGPKDVKKYVRK